MRIIDGLHNLVKPILAFFLAGRGGWSGRGSFKWVKRGKYPVPLDRRRFGSFHLYKGRSKYSTPHAGVAQFGESARVRAH